MATPLDMIAVFEIRKTTRCIVYCCCAGRYNTRTAVLHLVRDHALLPYEATQVLERCRATLLACTPSMVVRDKEGRI